MQSKLTYFVLLLPLLFFYNCKKNEVPICTITNPLIGEEIVAGAIVKISVDVNDRDNIITEVRFYIDNKDVASVYNFPYYIEWNSFSEEIGYHSIKAVAINDEGAISTDEIEVEITNTFTDTRDKHEYHIVQIAEQIWMAENLAYLPNVSHYSVESINEPCYYVYDYKGTNVSEAKATDNYSTYGVLYNWKAAINACPSGWHLPSNDEWKQLEMDIGMSQSEADRNKEWRGTDEGKKLKARIGWFDSGNGNDEYGFSALPGGKRHFGGKFELVGFGGYWWSATNYGDYRARHRYLYYEFTNIYQDDFTHKYGFSVRCVKD